MTATVNVRAKLVDLVRRDLIGPHPDLDPDLAREVLQDEKPSRWYVGLHRARLRWRETGRDRR
jgi:hypothetical protein